MLYEVPLFGALAPSTLLYFLAAIMLFVAIDKLIAAFGVYRFLWHPSLARFGIFLCVFSALVFATRS